MEYVICGLLGVAIVLLIVLLAKSGRPAKDDALSAAFEEEKAASRERHEQLRRTMAEDREAVLTRLSENNEKQLQWQNEQTAKTQQTMLTGLTRMQESNEKKLDEMRRTVDEKLDETLTKRLDSSFRAVTEQLTKVYESLGQMKELSTGVTDLQRLLTNVKARGTWAEVQLGELLEQFLTPDQFLRNVSIRNNREMVEYAIKIPSREAEGEYHLLPIDSKFPLDAYSHVQEAAATADPQRTEEACKNLEREVKEQARKIADLYIDVPRTTDFAILFLPTEGLYAEVLRRPGLAEEIQSKYRIMICGPTTIAAFLSTVKVGFRTLALDKQAAEVWKILSATRQQYEKFTDVLGKARKKIDEAGKAIDDAQFRNVQIQKKLKGVESLPEGEAEQLLGLNGPRDLTDILDDEGGDES